MATEFRGKVKQLEPQPEIRTVAEALTLISDRRNNDGIQAAIDLSERIVQNEKWSENEKDIIEGRVGPLRLALLIFGDLVCRRQRRGK